MFLKGWTFGLFTHIRISLLAKPDDTPGIVSTSTRLQDTSTVLIDRCWEGKKRILHTEGADLGKRISRTKLSP